MFSAFVQQECKEYAQEELGRRCSRWREKVGSRWVVRDYWYGGRVREQVLGTRGWEEEVWSILMTSPEPLGSPSLIMEN